MPEELTPPVTENPNEVTEQNQETQPNPNPEQSPDKEPAKQEETLLNGAKGKESKPAEEGEQTKAQEEGKADKPAEGAPEKYDAFKEPEGVKIDESVMNRFGEVAKKLDLSQEKAQSVIDELAPLMVQRQAESIANVSQQWREKSQNDPEIADHLGDIARLRDRFAVGKDGKIDPDIAEFMNSPAGNHPGVLKLLARAGKAFGEAGVPRGTSGGIETITANDIYKFK